MIKELLIISSDTGQNSLKMIKGSTNVNSVPLGVYI
jgi:hypothetical protein